jgi:hypothetical protein
MLDRGTLIFFGAMWFIFGAIWLYRSYRNRGFEKELSTLAAVEPVRIVRRERLTALWLGIANIALGIAWFAKAAWR